MEHFGKFKVIVETSQGDFGKNLNANGRLFIFM